MIIELDQDQQRLYSRLFVSEMDLSSARFSLSMLTKKGWHAMQWERRGSIYAQQTAYVTAFVIAYARPFNESRGWPRFPSALMPFTEDEQLLHKRIIVMRNKIVAHSDSSVYSVRPWRVEGFSTDIVGAPTMVITAEECALLDGMIEKLTDAISKKLKEILPET